MLSETRIEILKFWKIWITFEGANKRASKPHRLWALPRSLKPENFSSNGLVFRELLGILWKSVKLGRETRRDPHYVFAFCLCARKSNSCAAHVSFFKLKSAWVPLRKKSCTHIYKFVCIHPYLRVQYICICLKTWQTWPLEGIGFSCARIGPANEERIS